MVLVRRNVLLLIAILESFSGVAWSLRIYGVQDLCGTSIELHSPLFGLDSATIVKPKVQGAYTEGIENCSLAVKLHPNKYRLVVSVRRIDLRPNDQDVLSVQVQDENLYLKSTYTSSSNKYDPDESDRLIPGGDHVTITFTTASGGDKTSNFKGFELTVTLIEVPPCETHQFRCKTYDLCIAEELKCDGHNHCGDRSDLPYCGNTSTTSATVSTTFSATVSTTGVTTGGATSTLHDTALARWIVIGGLTLLSACFD